MNSGEKALVNINVSVFKNRYFCLKQRNRWQSSSETVLKSKFGKNKPPEMSARFT